MQINKKIAALFMGFAVFCSVAAPLDARAFSLGEFASQVMSLPQTIVNWFGGLFSGFDLFGVKKTEPAAPVENTPIAVQEPDEKTVKQTEIIDNCGNGKCEPGETSGNCQQDCPCVGLGGTLSPKNYCCAGLVAVNNYYQIDSRDNCFRKTDTAVKAVCVNCGNGKCETNEDKCNCPKDCGQAAAGCGNGKCEPGENAANCGSDCPVDECVKEGNQMLVPTQSLPQCCAGLYPIFDIVNYDVDCRGVSNGTMICAKCGNGICGKGENKCNCAKDCGDAMASCGDGKCEAGETMSSCAIDCGPRPMKPVIYLYPQKIEKVNVKVDYDGKIVADYPDYNPLAGWNVVAYPDGRLINQADGKEYSYLFWEGGDYGVNYDLSRGFVVKGSDTKQFLQETLSKIGLTPKEYNEFIVYWYPKMKDNPYNIIYFAQEEYTSKAQLVITPNPDSILRVFMVFKPSQTKMEITPQIFAPFERKGFVAVEWGGSELK